MTEKTKKWTLGTVPESFWEPIDRAEGDREKFREIAMAMPAEELIELHAQYMAMAEELFTPRHLDHLGPNVSEDALMDIANWVVMQGGDCYFDIYDHPEKTPTRDMISGPSFASIMVEVYGDRFGEWIPWD
ncbi:MAG: hypothetical protein MJE77_44080 [Proteobacteria bacterium]|nr:hypothetical protein [Pseudomonadota bacterium]